MKKARFIVLIILSLFLAVFLVGCDKTSKVELTAENNTNIANILSELEESYHLMKTSKNEILLRGTKTNDASYVDDGSISFTLYIDSNDWNDGCKTARYVLKRLSAMCSNDVISTLSCFIYLSENGYYVNHTIPHSYSKSNPEDIILSITEFDSDNLQMAYEAFGEDHNLEPHHTWEHEGIKYMDADLRLKPTGNGWWFCDANLHFNENYTNDKLIEIGEHAHAFLGSALTIYSLENNNIPNHISYDITIFGNEYYVTGENKDNSETLVWESNTLK